MGYEWKVCYDRLTAGHMTPCSGSDNPYHCTSFQQTDAYHNSCEVSAIYQPVQAILCKNRASGEVYPFRSEQLLDGCNALYRADPNWFFYTCYCCCSCFAHGTHIASIDGEIEVQEIDRGSKILVGSIDKTDGLHCIWEEGEVTFSNGTETGEQPAMVYIVYGKDRELIVSPDHVFLMADGSFITARYLYPGDQFVDREGNPVDIITASIGHYKGGVHHIAVNENFDGTADGHLVLSGGIVSGDFTLQMNYDSLVSGQNALTGRYALGSEEYLESFRDRIHQKGIYYFSDRNTVLKRNEKFQAYNMAEGLRVPSGARVLFSPEQENDIFVNGTQFPVSVSIGYGGALYVIKLMKGFYPDVNIRLEWKLRQPNMYVFYEKDCKTVVISGGLVRMEGLNAEGLALLTAMSVGRFYGEEGEKICSKGKAEFYGASAITRMIWYGNMWMNPTLEALKQVTKLFNLITPENGEADLNDPAEGLAVSCRLASLNSGIVGGSMPVCAGGDEKPKLMLERAEEDERGVKLSFSLDVKSGAGDTANYVFTPEVKVIKALQDEDKRFYIHLEADLEPDTEYSVAVENLASVYDTDLDPEAASVKVIRKNEIAE